MSSREEYQKACQMMAWEYGTVEEGSQRVAAEQMGIITAYVTSLEQERDELKKQLEGVLAMYDIRLKKFDDLKARLDEEGFTGE